MVFRFLIFGALILCAHRTEAQPIVQIKESDIPSPPATTHSSTSNAAMDVTLQLRNESMTDPVLILLWQVGLALTADASATGQLLWGSANDPTVPFLDSPSDPAVVGGVSLPSAEVLIQDADMPPIPEPPGKSLGANEVRDILHLQIVGTPDARGTFFVSLADFNESAPTTGSVWLSDGFPPAPAPFLNHSDGPEGAILAEIVWGGGSDADFNGDGRVDGRDLAVWQRGVRQGASQSEGDANHDGVVDDRDRLIWEQEFGKARSAPFHIAIPELQTAQQCFVCAVIVSLVGLSNRSPHDRVSLGARACRKLSTYDRGVRGRPDERNK